VTRERFEENASAFARALGFSASAISQIVSTKNNPSYETVLALAEFLECDPQEVLAGTAPSFPRPQDPYPARASALRRLAGVIPEATARRIRDVVQLDGETPYTEVRWLRLALRWAQEDAEAEEDARIRASTKA
jgi:transcriptional regulator with XRE-family HTH domain